MMQLSLCYDDLQSRLLPGEEVYNMSPGVILPNTVQTALQRGQ